MTEPGSYTFVPWFRRGAAAGITEPDDLTATATTGRASVIAELTLGYTALPGVHVDAVPPISRTVELIGPADVGGLKLAAVLRAYPAPDSRAANPNELAYIEFYEEDLPWRFTPVSPVASTMDGVTVSRLRPWITLLVLRDDEFDLAPRAGGLPMLTVKDTAPLPPVDEAWAWAHAQLADVTTAAGAGAAAQADPDGSLSRLLSPRRLAAGGTYTAFVVPAFDTGRRAGLGQDVTGIPRQRPAWGPDVTERRFPVYYSWSFATGTDGGFESYVRRLTAQPVDQSFGKRPVDLTGAGYGVSGPATMSLEGALRPLEFDREDFPTAPGDQLVDALESLVDTAVGRMTVGAATELDPGVVPPAYGRWHAGVTRVADAAGDSAWVREVNLDPRERAAAGLGAQIVRNRQDDLMERAWSQVGELRGANQRLREAELATAAAEALFGKHLNGLGEDRLMLLTSPAHGGLLAPEGGSHQSVRGLVRTSAVPSATEDGAFKRVVRPDRALLRQATGRREIVGFQDGQLLRRLNDADASAAPAVPAPVGSVALQSVAAAAAAAGAAIAPKLLEPKRVFWQLLVGVLSARVQSNGSIALPTAPQLIGEAATALIAWRGTHPADGPVGDAVDTLITAIRSVNADGPEAVAVVITAAAFDAAFGVGLAGKGGNGVTVMRQGAPPDGKISRMADADGAAEYEAGVNDLGADLAVRLSVAPAPLAPIGALPAVAGAVLDALRPEGAMFNRMATAVAGLADLQLRQPQARPRPFQPVLAHPRFSEPMVDALQALDREHILPNVGALPADTLTLMAPNGRFIEAFFAGLNTEMARELLWREYPTDQRGSYFRVFWSRSDALSSTVDADIKPLPEWTSALGLNGTPGFAPIVLVIRSELLRAYPNTVVYAQRAIDTPTGRTLDLNAMPVFPAFHANLDPDIALVGFQFSAKAARGRPATSTTAADPGFFFVLKERPGQARFGLDATAPAGGLQTWDDLWWGQLAGSGDYLTLEGNTVVPASPAGSPGHWAATAADMAAILMRSPVMYARHAADMLPQEDQP